MPDIERRLRQTFRDVLDPIAPDARRAAESFRRARRGRIVRGLAAGTASVLVIAVAAAAWERRDGEGPRPAAPPPDVTTYALSFDDGGTGTLTIDLPKAQACVKLSGTDAMSAHLHQTSGAPVAELTVGHAGGWPLCTPVDPDAAAAAVRDPGSHYVELHGPMSDRVSALGPFELAPEEAPAMAEIVCSDGGAVAVTPQVRPQEDGIHLRFYNPSRRWRAFNLFNGKGENEGGRLGFGRDDNVSGFPPGPLYAGCFDELDDTFSPGDADYTTFTIVDPDDLWTEPELECDRELERRVVLTDEPFPQDRFELPDFDSLIREHLPGLEPGDVLERPRYPESEFHFEPRTVVRDGRRIAGVMLVPKNGYWAIHPRVCPGSGIAS